FVDAWGIGDGEKLIDPILDSLFETAGAPRRERLRALAAIPGVYVPSLYECEYRGGKFSAINPLDDAAPASIHRAVEMDMDKCPIPPSFPIPIVESVSGKAAIEIMRGCPEGCRFCQAGYSYRPARVRGAKSIRDAAVWLAASAGWDEITLQSLSALNHPDIARIFRELREVLDPLRVSVALPSLRMDALSRELAADIRRPRETSLTFAIEAGSGRLRDAINKRVGEDDIFATLDAALEAGWHKFKLYFMCGFAGETMDDLDETSALIRRISARAKKAGGKRTSVHASMSVLVPKPVTPLAWQPMERPEVTVMKTARVARAVRDLKNVKFHWHDPDKSALEALFSRGDRRMGYVLAAAHARGVLPPTLSEGAFDASPWFEICADESVYPPDVPPVDAEESLYGERPKDAPFPWSHIDYGINEAWLARELRRFESGRPTPSCEEKCEYCGIACG
ncbi:MAG: radical SAM protein, partial [bacterium]